MSRFVKSAMSEHVPENLKLWCCTSKPLQMGMQHQPKMTTRQLHIEAGGHNIYEGSPSLVCCLLHLIPTGRYSKRDDLDLDGKSVSAERIR